MKYHNAYQTVSITYHQQLSDTVYEMRLLVPDSACMPGQFLNLYPEDGATILPRPMSICDYDGNELRLVYQVVGKGTAAFSKLAVGSMMRILTPLGNGFDVPKENGVHVLCAGGIGAPPLLMLSKALKGEIHVYLGFRSEPLWQLVDDFKKITPHVFIATDDGRAGFHGTVTALLNAKPAEGNYYACGPKPMLQSFCTYLSQKGKDGQISLESYMACGVGACVGCAVPIQKKGSADWYYLKTCKDGPVFQASEVVWI